MEEYVRKLIREELDKIFLTEKQHVSAEVHETVLCVIKQMEEQEKNTPPKQWMPIHSTNDGEKKEAKKSMRDFVVKSDNLFFEKIFLRADFIKIISNDENLDLDEIFVNTNRGHVYNNNIIMNEYKIKEAAIDLTLCYIDGIDNGYTYSVVEHELEHIFKILKTQQLDTSKKDTLSNSLRQKIQKTDKLGKLVTIFYCLCKSEISANIQAIYGELYNKKTTNKDGLIESYYETSIYKNFFQYLRYPENLLSKEYIENLTLDDFKWLNTKIKEILTDFKLSGTEKKYDIYFKPTDTINGYFERLFKICKIAYDKLFRNVGSVISLIIDQKGKSFIAERKFQFKNVYDNPNPFPFEDEWGERWVSSDEV